MSDTEEDSKDKSKRPLEVSSEGNDEVEEKRSSRKRGKNLKIFRPFGFWFLTEEIQYHDGLRSRELGQAPILLCAPNS